MLELSGAIILILIFSLIFVLAKYHETNKTLADATEPYRLEIERYVKALESAWSNVSYQQERNAELSARLKTYEAREKAIMQRLAENEIRLTHSENILN